jgi:hypothetical protein
MGGGGALEKAGSGGLGMGGAGAFGKAGAEVAGRTGAGAGGGSAGGGGGAVGDTARTPTTVPPHRAQNFTPGGKVAPHVGHGRPAGSGSVGGAAATTGLPHVVQNRAFDAISEPQLAHAAMVITPSSEAEALYRIPLI